jgi:nucleoside-diphosphate-sugar epimerase
VRALVVGGAGFIGRPVCRRLLADGWDVWVADNLVIQPEEPLPAGIHFHWADVRYYSQITLALEVSRPEIVFWLAARQGYGDDWRWFASVNVAPAYALAEALREADAAGRPVQRVVLASSQAVYAPGMQVQEDHPKVPTSVYGLSKWQQEQAFEHFARAGGPPVVALRPSIVLGRGQAVQSSESGVLRNWARAVQAGRRPEIYGTGEHVRDFVHVEDVAEAFVRAAQQAPGGARPPFVALNLGGPSASLLELARLFQAAWGGCPEPEVLGREVRPGGEFSMTSDPSAAWEALGGWVPGRGIEQQVGDFVAGCRKPSE